MNRPCDWCGRLFESYRHSKVEGGWSRFCSRSCARHGRNGPAELRFLARVDQTADCWFWRGPINKNGYGAFTSLDRPYYAHRWSYEHFVGPIPSGLTIDHKCHNADFSCKGGPACKHRACVNPEHLEAVTSRTNVMRSGNAAATINFNKTHCINGHEFTRSNTGVQRAHGQIRGRFCRSCERARKKVAV